MTQNDLLQRIGAAEQVEVLKKAADDLAGYLETRDQQQGKIKELKESLDLTVVNAEVEALGSELFEGKKLLAAEKANIIKQIVNNDEVVRCERGTIQRAEADLAETNRQIEVLRCKQRCAEHLLAYAGEITRLQAAQEHHATINVHSDFENLNKFFSNAAEKANGL